ncbi:hypothetical protein KIK06_26480 [Nocardiopsis sp. EMB25]|uniref:hypothetical protein n=1 Tax=Nocardiopsis sp. EMB25 TaxID=2835867 RepID=UPI0022838CFF|nr:hypothetical protein [Nocardiopsis sp. EMB25]MCY9787433.1 hypothetical protein [Nocardiopsis sp. EMB25]
MSESQPCRPLRAGVFTLVCASLSAHGHALSSGHDVPLAGLLLGVVVVMAMAWAAAKRRHGPLVLAGWMLWGQFALHLAFSYTQLWGGGHGTHLAAADNPSLAADAAAYSANVAEAASGGSLSTWQMLAMHVMAALLSAWWLHRGENSLFAFLRFMALTLFPLLIALGRVRVLPEPAIGRGPWNDEGRSQPLLPYLRYARILRGPPPAPRTA